MQPYFQILSSASGTPICTCMMHAENKEDGDHGTTSLPPVCDLRSLARIMLTLHGPSSSTSSNSHFPQSNTISSLRLQLRMPTEEQTVQFSCVASMETKYILFALVPEESLLAMSVAHIAVYSVLYSLSRTGDRTCARVVSVHKAISKRNEADDHELELLNAGGASGVTKSVDPNTYLLSSLVHPPTEDTSKSVHDAPQRLLHGIHSYIINSMQDGAGVVHITGGSVSHIAQNKNRKPVLNECSLRRVAHILWSAGQTATDQPTSMTSRWHVLMSMNARLQSDAAVQVVLFVAFQSVSSSCVASIACFPVAEVGKEANVRRYHVLHNSETSTTDIVDLQLSTKDEQYLLKNSTLSEEARAFSVRQFRLVDAALSS